MIAVIIATRTLNCKPSSFETEGCVCGIKNKECADRQQQHVCFCLCCVFISLVVVVVGVVWGVMEEVMGCFAGRRVPRRSELM